MKFFFDRSIPIALARMVRAIDGANLEIVHHDEDPRFNPKTTDIEWLQAIRGDGDPPWIIVSGDGAILKNKVERQVLDEVGLPYFCLDGAWPKKEIYEYAWKFMKVWPKIVATAKNSKGRIFKISAGSSLKIEKLM